jgi:hypothetical protein
MKDKNIKLFNRSGLRKGATFVELLITVVISVIPLSAVGVLIVGGQQNWHKAFRASNREIEIQGQAATAIFSNIGRKAYIANCVLGAITESSNSLVAGKSIQFTYVPSSDKKKKPRGRKHNSNALLPVPTQFALFYFVPGEKKLKIDYGRFPFHINQTSFATAVIAENVEDVRFIRSKIGNVLQRCVNMEMTLKDPVNGDIVTVMATTLMRN